MANYTKILFALDLQPQDDNPVAERVNIIAKATNAELHLIHVVEQLSYSYGEPFVSANYLEWQAELEENAQKNLEEAAQRLKIPEEQQHLEVGKPYEKILEVAQEIKADLIIVGSHGRHGLQKLVLGSTANAVLQNAPCDVLAVKVSD